MAVKDAPIQRKLMMMILLTSVVVLFLTSGSFFAYEYFAFRQEILTRLAVLGEIIATNSSAALVFDNQEDAQEILVALQAEENIVSASVYDINGELFSRYPARLPISDFPTGPEEDGYRFVDAHVVGYQPIVQNGRRQGTLFIRSDLSPMYGRIKVFAMIGASIVVASFLVALVLSRSLQKQVSVPVLALAETAKAVAERGDYSVQAEKLGGGELGLLTDAFNRMLAQIHEQEQGLTKLNAELEQRVQERTAELQASNRELESFAYSVAHDLRAPLRSVHGFSQTLMEDLGPTLAAPERDHLKRICGAAKKMGDLIDNLLNLSRLMRVDMKREQVNLSTLAQSIADELHSSDTSRTVTWVIQPDIIARGDKQLLSIALTNLFDNAWKYTGKKAKARIEFCATEQDGETVYYIKDNGAGFDMDYAGQLFGVFQRLHSNNDFEGIGIGLATVQRIIHRHGGRIWAEARVDEGATFYFTL